MGFLGSLFGSIGKGIAKPFKDTTKAVKSVSKSVGKGIKKVTPGGGGKKSILAPQSSSGSNEAVGRIGTGRKMNRDV